MTSQLRHPLKITPVKPIGKRKITGFYDGHRNGRPFGGYGTIEVDEYPESAEGKRFWEARVAARVSPRDLGKRFGLSAVQIYALGFGRATTDADGWAQLHAAITELAQQ